MQVQSKHPFPPYSLSPNYTPPNVVHVPDENIDHSAPIPLESQQPQSGHAHVAQPMGETHEVPRDHTLATLSLTPDMLLRGKHLVAYPSQTSWGPLIIAHNRNYNPYTFQWEDCLLPWWKAKNLIT